MIRNFNDFINESYLPKTEDDKFDTFGDVIENLYQDDYVKNIVNRYIDRDIDPSIRIANIINLLDDNIQNEIKAQIDEYFNNGIEEKDADVLVSTQIDSVEEAMAQEEISISGKGVFNSFLKSLTALGRKDNKPNFDICPDDFLTYYQFDDLSTVDVKSVFKRFKSLYRYVNLIDYGKNELSVYFGIKTDGYLEYGLLYDNRIPIGKFKLSKSAITWIIKITSKSVKSLKKELVNLSYKDLLLLGTIKNEMSQFRPGYFEKKSPTTVTDNIISFGYYGVGKWNNGKLDENELINIKNTFNTWVLSKKWGTKVLVSVKPESFWLYIHIKIKQ